MPAGTPFDFAQGKPALLKPAAMRGWGDFIFAYFTAQGVAVNSQEFCGAGLIAVGALEGALDEFLLKLNHSFFEQYAALDHLPNKRFQLFLHDVTLHSDASEHSLRGPVFIPFVMSRTAINLVDGR
jgi:hypothetical protein